MVASGRALAVALAVALPAAAVANDSEAAFGLGGLTLVESRDIVMDSEDLFISREQVRVTYRFINRSARDIETLVSFPLPGLPFGADGESFERAFPNFRQLKFRTTIDGRPVALRFVERAEVAGRDVTPRIAALGWEVRWFDAPDSAIRAISRLDAAGQAALRREGLIRPSRDDAATLIPAWKLVTHVTRRQRFPAGKTVTVSHAYDPVAGGSVSGSLQSQNRKEDWFLDHARKYCIDSDFLSGFDRRMSRAAGSGLFYGETWLSYILSSGANWRGPIGDFRLVVDKGKADNLVSFCMDGVRKISPTRFEVRKRNFEPKRDLDITIVEFIQPE